MRKLFDLAQANRGKGGGIRSEATSDDTTTVYVYDVIDAWWGIGAADFARTLAAISTPNILLRINSPGGDVFEARAMMAAIAEHPATVTAKVDGLAASAATALTLACNRVEMVEGSFYMIHRAWTFAMGNAADMRTTADLLDKVDGVLTDGYVAKTGKARDEIEAWMAAETWFDAQEAVDAGFADAAVPLITASKAAKACAFNLGVYEKAPKALTAPPETEQVDDAVRVRMMARLGLYERTAP